MIPERKRNDYHLASRDTRGTEIIFQYKAGVRKLYCQSNLQANVEQVTVFRSSLSLPQRLQSAIGSLKWH